MKDEGSTILRGADDVVVLARNLIDNAVRYSPDGGRVSERVEEIDHRPRPAGG